jgi:hypothetical protein
MRRETSIGRKLLLTGIGPRPLRVEPWGRGAHRRRIIQFHKPVAAQRLTSSRRDPGPCKSSGEGSFGYPPLRRRLGRVWCSWMPLGRGLLSVPLMGGSGRHVPGAGRQTVRMAGDDLLDAVAAGGQ